MTGTLAAEAAADWAESLVQICANGPHRTDDHHWDESREQAIFNGRGTLFVLQEAREDIHFDTPGKNWTNPPFQFPYGTLKPQVAFLPIRFKKK